MGGASQSILFRRPGYAYLVLGLMAFLAFSPLFKSEFIFDDIEFVESNPELKEVRSFSDCFSYEFQPSKPVSTFFIALAHWLGGGSVMSHRLFSILFHALVVLLLYWNLCQFNLRLEKERRLPIEWLFGAVALFSVAPIHSETIGVAQFRGEILASAFTLLACLGAQLLVSAPRSLGQRLGLYGLVFLGMGLAQLSKEVFALIAPTTVLLFYYLPLRDRFRWRAMDWRFLGAVVAMEIVLSILVARGIERDTVTNYTYAGNVGYGVISTTDHLILATRALIEGFYKTLLGINLTTVRLGERGGFADQLNFWQSLIASGSFFVLIGAFARRHRFVLLSALLFCVGFGIYLVIPNKNIGSEHYLYFASIGLFAMVAYAVGTLCQCFGKRLGDPIQTAVALLLVYCAGEAILLQKRLATMQSKVKFYLAEVEAAPESAINWVNAANVLMGTNPNFMGIAQMYLQSAKKIDPNLRNIYGAELVLSIKLHQVDQAEKQLEVIEKYDWAPRDLSRFHYDFGRLAYYHKRCPRAAIALARAVELDPHNKKYIDTYVQFKNDTEKNRKKLCQ